MTKNGNKIEKIACSEYWKGKDSYKKLQDSFYEYLTKNGFDLERGNTKENTHIPIETLKSVTNYDNIKYELSQEDIKPLETENIDLILKQNQDLIKYTKKLKTYLAKSYSSINATQELQQENINLKCENNYLKQENKKLKNYINKTFEVVKHLFDCPVDTLKRLVDKYFSYHI